VIGSFILVARVRRPQNVGVRTYHHASRGHVDDCGRVAGLTPAQRDVVERALAGLEP
jgi:hypothetical protein